METSPTPDPSGAPRADESAAPLPPMPDETVTGAPATGASTGAPPIDVPVEPCSLASRDSRSSKY